MNRRIFWFCWVSVLLWALFSLGACNNTPPSEKTPDASVEPKKEVTTEPGKEPVVDNKEPVVTPDDGGVKDEPPKDDPPKDDPPKDDPPVTGKCEPPTDTPASGEVCVVKPGGKSILILAHLLLPNKTQKNGQLLIDEDGKIACVGCGCMDKAKGATVVSCPTTIPPVVPVAPIGM